MKISVIGLGNVGSTLAYTLVLRGLASELVLYNRTEAKARGDALDLTHALSFTDSVIPVRAGSLQDTSGSDILAVCVSVPMSAAVNTRMDLAKGNVPLFRELIPELAVLSPDAVLLVVTNPVDLMTRLALELSEFPVHRVLGVGTLIDSARLRMQLSQRWGIHPSDLRAYVLGEHGETQFAAWSVASAGGERIPKRPEEERLFQAAARAGNDIVQAKGYTNFAIASATALVVENIVHNKKQTIPVSIHLQEYFGVRDVCLSVPAVVGRQGVVKVLQPDLSPEEIQLFRHSAATVEAQWREIGGA